MKKITTYIVFLLIGLLCTPVAWSQSDTVSQAPLPEIEYSAHRKVYEIADIAVTGADSYEDYVIIGFSGLAVGDKVEVPGNQITKAVRRFWKQGLFSEVRIVATKMTDKQVWLEIQLKQRPRISELEYRGMKKSEREDVETKVGIARGNQMTPNLADRAKTVIKKYYEEKGYHNADVRIIEQPDQEHKGYVKVYIDVDKRVIKL